MPFNTITIQDLTGLDYRQDDFILLKSSDGVTTTSTTTTSTTLTPPPPTTTTTIASYGYGGTVSIYANDTLACANKTCGRSYHLAQPSWSVGYTVYDDVALTTPFNGGGNWIAVATSTSYCSGGWAAIQVSSAGVILNIIGCP